VLAQVLLLERRVFRLRAERYTYLHPGQLFQSGGTGSMGFAPWNRPPLPTYAAALAASGYGTGDVEDHLIAAPPPPAYGNTRGSTLLLSGFLRDSLRAQRPISGSSTRSNPPPRQSLTRVEGESPAGGEPERTRVLEQTLARLEEARPSTSRTTTPQN
jgi:hypothetical protein